MSQQQKPNPRKGGGGGGAGKKGPQPGSQTRPNTAKPQPQLLLGNPRGGRPNNRGGGGGGRGGRPRNAGNAVRKVIAEAVKSGKHNGHPKHQHPHHNVVHRAHEPNRYRHLHYEYSNRTHEATRANYSKDVNSEIEKAGVWQKIKHDEDQEQAMLIAKQLPGVISARLVLNGSVLDTIPIKSTSTRILESIYSYQHGIIPMGTQNYVVMLSCVGYTLFHGAGTINHLPASAKLGGVGIFQCDSLQQTATLNNFMQQAEIGKTMDEMYGSSGDNSANTTSIFASLLEIDFISQQAGTTGCVYEGYLPHSSLYSEDGVAQNFKVDDLVRNSIRTQKLDGANKVFLHSALRVDANVTMNPHSTKDQQCYAMAGEVVSYIVIDRAYTQFGTGTNQVYSMSVHSHCNAIGWARIDDAFAPSGGSPSGGGQINTQTVLSQGTSQARSLFEKNPPPVELSFGLGSNKIGSVFHTEHLLTRGRSTVENPRPQSTIENFTSDPNVIAKISKNYASGKSWFQRSMSQIRDWYDSNQDWIAPSLSFAKHALPLLMDGDEDDDVIGDGQFYLDMDYINKALRHMDLCLSQVPPECTQLSDLRDAATLVFKQTKGYAGIVPLNTVFPPVEPPIPVRTPRRVDTQKGGA